MQREDLGDGGAVDEDGEVIDEGRCRVTELGALAGEGKRVVGQRMRNADRGVRGSTVMALQPGIDARARELHVAT